MRRAFSLLEILIAVAVLVMLAVAMSTFLRLLNDRRETVLSLAHQQRTGSHVIEQLEQDLFRTIARARDEAGVKGTSESIVLFSRGVSATMAGSDASVRLSDLQGTEIRFDERTWTVEGRRWNGDDDRGTFEMLSDRVERLRFRYYDGEQWVDTFDSLARSSLPVAVEVAIWFARPGASSPAALEEEDLPTFGDDLPEDEDLFEGETSDFARDGAETTDMPGMSERMQGDVLRQPDRMRLITVPDGPVTAWRESR